jgi:hypothetical protein
LQSTSPKHLKTIEEVSVSLLGAELSQKAFAATKKVLCGMVLSSLLTVGCSSDEKTAATNELGQLGMELDSVSMTSAQSSLAEQIKKGADNKEILLASFVETHRENYRERYKQANNGEEPISSTEMIEKIKQLSAAEQDLFNLKKNLENSISENPGNLVYNRDNVSLFDYVNDGKMQCYSGTSLLEVLRQLQASTSVAKDDFVVIFENGHVLPGYMNKVGLEYNLVGIETTVNGAGQKQYGPVKNLQQVRVMDSDFFMAIEVLESVITNRQAVVNKALEITALRYGIDLSSTENTLANIEKLFTYKSLIALNAEEVSQHNAILSEQLNASLFQFGDANTPAGDQTRPTMETVPSGQRGFPSAAEQNYYIAEEKSPMEREIENGITFVEEFSPIIRQQARELQVRKLENALELLFSSRSCLSHATRSGIHQTAYSRDLRGEINTFRPREVKCVEISTSAWDCGVPFERDGGDGQEALRNDTIYFRVEKTASAYRMFDPRSQNRLYVLNDGYFFSSIEEFIYNDDKVLWLNSEKSEPYHQRCTR